jgi:hypothetical protein
MSIRAGASWGAIALSAGLLAYAAQPASANLLTNGDFATCVPPLPVSSPFSVANPDTHDRWNGNGWVCTSTPSATGNDTQYGRQNANGSNSEILQGVPLAGQCVPAGSSVKLSFRYVNQGPGTTSLAGVATLYSFATGGTWGQFPGQGGWPMTNQTLLGTVGMPVGLANAAWSTTQSVTAAVPANAVALGVALRMGYQGGQGPGDVIHGVDDVSLTLASFPASVNVDPDTLNLRARGNDITAYISVPDCLSAGDIDGSTVKLTSINGNVVSFNATRSNLQGSVLMVKFSRQAVQAAIVGFGLTLPAVVPVTIEGELEDGTAFTATDTIRVINP